jgi:outer membrane murein-binding lipoprotein Lpp
MAAFVAMSRFIPHAVSALRTSRSALPSMTMPVFSKPMSSTAAAIGPEQPAGASLGKDTTITMTVGLAISIVGGAIGLMGCVAAVTSSYSQLSSKVDHVSTDLTALSTRMDARDAKMDARDAQIQNLLLWLNLNGTPGFVATSPNMESSKARGKNR